MSGPRRPGPADRPIERFASADDFATWLRDHQDDEQGVWITFAKRGSSERTPGYEEILDVALRFGWIDSQVRRLDDRFYLQAFTPRRARSPWSRRNREKAEAMIEAGTMEPAGLAAVERAKADGRWDRAYEGPANAQPPADFLAALAANPAARAFYQTLDAQNRYAVYFRLHDAVRPETRARRIERFVAQLARGERFH
ncbi:MAG TPA: YdeI/OmpD-associated family protein [Candidatus Limnocylindrales bacterium]|nr:YdeI/OmpD-associated family protein [Candidatus Limnocylindrales bacterium]